MRNYERDYDNWIFKPYDYQEEDEEMEEYDDSDDRYEYERDKELW